MPVRNKKVGTPFPEYQTVTSRMPRTRRAYVGEVRAFGFRAYAEQEASPVWREGVARIFNPFAELVATQTILPQGNVYTSTVNIEIPGMWLIEFEYGHDSRPEEILKHRIYVRAVS